MKTAARPVPLPGGVFFCLHECKIGRVNGPEPLLFLTFFEPPRRRSFTYELRSSGALHIKIGRPRLVPREAIEAYIASLLAAGRAS